VAWRKNDPNLTNNPTYLEARLSQVEGKVATLDKQNKQSAIIGHGLNIINASQNSPLDIKIEGRTLVNVSQNVLDPTKYYVLAGKNFKVKFADATTYAGVAKFQGRAEKPILIRVSNFEGKVSGSTVENPHIAHVGKGTTLLSPSAFTTEYSTTDYANTSKLDGTLKSYSTTVNGEMAQDKRSFNLIEAIERTLGKIPASDTAGKVAWLKNNIAKLTCNWWGRGESPSGYKATVAMWRVDNNGYDQNWINNVKHTNSTVTKLSGNVTNMNLCVDSNGFVHFLAYAEPSDGVTASTIYTDYVELEIELKPEAQLWNPRLPLYEVDATKEYPNILTTWDENEVMRRYPMVESVQHVQNPYVIAEGENLLPPFTEWSTHTNATITSPYTVSFNATGSYQEIYFEVPFIIGQTYTYSIESKTGNGEIKIRALDASLNILAQSYSQTSSSVSLTVPPNTNKLRVYVGTGSNTSGTFTFTNPMLTLGSTAKPFVPRNPSMLLIDGVKLGALSDKKDILFKDGQDWKVTRWIQDVLLDGSLGWQFIDDKTGFKRLKYVYQVSSTSVLVKYNGLILKMGNTNDAADIYSSGSEVVISVSDTDSGWGENYTPSSAEIKAYFYGWRMCDGNYGVPYNGTGTKTWYPIGDTDLSRATTTCPTSAAPTISEGKISYYKLSYVLATPQTIVVTDKVEGDLVVNGATQVEVGSGVIVREKVTPSFYSVNNYYYINEKGVSGLITDNPLKNKAYKIISVYKNGIEDKKWIREDNTSNQNGQMAKIPQADFDPTAEYTVTYLVLDRHLFTTNILAVTATYDSSLKSVVDSLVTKLGDMGSNQQALIRSVAELYKRIKALGG
jgi:hypothetical protein